ncbi:MAG: hypothetical protein LW689_01540, partial [Novosphingobium sp.]|nr:hypothetical protein [Novosphingobium sp.]
LAALNAAAGQELASGKFKSPVSSSALAVNCFGWFIERAELLPPLPGISAECWPARSVGVEREMRLPWRGGMHPWLDAVIETETHLIGIEAKRFEPFRDHKEAKFRDTYDRDVWGDGLQPFATMRDRLKASPRMFVHLDAAQLVKHALGLATQARKAGKSAVLQYLFAEPASLDGKIISQTSHRLHREEIGACMQRLCSPDLDHSDENAASPNAEI